MLTFRHLVLAISLAALPGLAVAQADLQAMRIQPDPGLGGYDAPFWPDGSYRDDVRSPSDFLGYTLGSHPTTHADMVRYFEYLDGLDTAELHDYGQTYEGRRLVYLVVASEANAKRLDAIKSDCQKLADPRKMEKGETASAIIARMPAIGWMAYGIHGDELSSGEAALQLAYQMVAGTDAATRHILDNCVVIIDPAENPDGRTRWLTQLTQWNSVVTSYDTQSMSHTGMWPYGRTNHYLFDLNRDWFAQVHPESRGKTAAMLEWMPHYVLDCHEMGPLDTYLISPPREPFNPHLTSYIHKWWERIASEHAAEFDRFGWSYYTREWNEEMFPGYGSSWASYVGAIGFLFEQAGIDGSQVKRPDGTIMTYRESIHHQFVGSMADLTAIADGRAELLHDYYQQKVDNLHSKPAAYVYAAGDNRTRLDRFVETLERQKIEVERTTKAFKIARAQSWDGTDARDIAIPAGSAIVRTNQPERQLVEAILSFDNRISTKFLESEREEVLSRGDTRLYDATGWSLSLAYGLEAFRMDGAPGVSTEPFKTGPRTGSLSNDAARVGFAFDGRDDRSFELLARLFEHGIHVWCSRKPFKSGNAEFSPGSYLIRRNGNPNLDVDALRALAVASGVDVVGLDGGLATGKYADLGGNEFELLAAPRIAVVGGSGVNAYNFGAIWHLLDSRMRVRMSIIDIANLAGAESVQVQRAGAARRFRRRRRVQGKARRRRHRANQDMGARRRHAGRGGRGRRVPRRYLRRHFADTHGTPGPQRFAGLSRGDGDVEGRAPPVGRQSRAVGQPHLETVEEQIGGRRRERLDRRQGPRPAHARRRTRPQARASRHHRRRRRRHEGVARFRVPDHDPGAADGRPRVREQIRSGRGSLRERGSHPALGPSVDRGACALEQHGVRNA